jgi:hypothetical protein
MKKLVTLCVVLLATITAFSQHVTPDSLLVFDVEIRKTFWGNYRLDVKMMINEGHFIHPKSSCALSNGRRDPRLPTTINYLLLDSNKRVEFNWGYETLRDFKEKGNIKKSYPTYKTYVDKQKIVEREGKSDSIILVYKRKRRKGSDEFTVKKELVKDHKVLCELKNWAIWKKARFKLKAKESKRLPKPNYLETTIAYQLDGQGGRKNMKIILPLPEKRSKKKK